MYHVSLAVQCICIYGCSNEGTEDGDGKDGREWRLLGLMYGDDLVLCGDSEEDLRVMVERFAEVCRRRGLKANGGKSKVIVLNGEEGLECEVHVDGIRLEHVLDFNIWSVFWTNQVQMEKNAVGRWPAGGEGQVPSDPWLIIGICSFSVLESCKKRCLCLFLRMAARQCYGRRRSNLQLGLYR